MMRRVLAGYAILSIVSLIAWGVPHLYANELLKDGTAVSLPAMENALKTIDHNMTSVIVPVLALGVALLGASITPKFPAVGLGGIGVGIGIPFLPGIIGSGMEKASAATALVFVIQTPFQVWVQWGQSIAHEACFMLIAWVGYRHWKRHVD